MIFPVASTPFTAAPGSMLTVNVSSGSTSSSSIVGIATLIEPTPAAMGIRWFVSCS